MKDQTHQEQMQDQVQEIMLEQARQRAPSIDQKAVEPKTIPSEVAQLFEELHQALRQVVGTHPNDGAYQRDDDAIRNLKFYLEDPKTIKSAELMFVQLRLAFNNSALKNNFTGRETTLRTRLKELMDKYSLENFLAASQRDNSKLSEEVKRLSRVGPLVRVDGLNTKINSLEQEKLDLKTKLGLLEATTAADKERIHELKSTIARLEDQLSDFTGMMQKQHRNMTMLVKRIGMNGTIVPEDDEDEDVNDNAPIMEQPSRVDQQGFKAPAPVTPATVNRTRANSSTIQSLVAIPEAALPQNRLVNENLIEKSRLDIIIKLGQHLRVLKASQPASVSNSGPQFENSNKARGLIKQLIIALSTDVRSVKTIIAEFTEKDANAFNGLTDELKAVADELPINLTEQVKLEKKSRLLALLFKDDCVGIKDEDLYSSLWAINQQIKANPNLPAAATVNK